MMVKMARGCAGFVPSVRRAVAGGAVRAVRRAADEVTPSRERHLRGCRQALSREVLPGSVTSPGWPYRERREPQDRSARLPHDPPRQAHPRPGRAARVRREPPRHRAAPGRGGPAGRDQRRVLHPARTRQRRRRVRQRPGRHRARTAARRRRTRPPSPPGPNLGHAAQQADSPPLAGQDQSALYDQAGPGGTPNSARFIFLDPRAGDFFVDYDRAANDCVAFLRAEAGRDPYDKNLTDLIGELSTRSDDFRLRWAAHDVKYHRTGRKRFHHPLVGELELDYEALELAGDPGQRINVYTAPPDSAAEDALRLLASWTLEQAAPASATAADETPTSS